MDAHILEACTEEVKHILFEEYHFKSIEELWERSLDEEFLAELYQQFKFITEKYGVNGDELDSILDTL
ncbi:hypothetical protein AAN93_001330 [Salmonella enterica subsp. enterica]|uniref:MafI family immunity protein n=1 Tax=Salmonella enterica TaxID=28901 RepID=A0A7D8IR39_SALER|nr:hypothetical protein [Salmonella enterica subsp. enterica serovar Kintambo]EDR2897658.1 hypothetical protein [Salmonella enterica subsp. enterica serovar Amherstiana]SUF98297.1 Uncharacterised protein [Salmonella enterica]